MEEITDSGAYLKKAREEKGLTLLEMGNASGLSESGVWRIENRGKSMHVSTFFRALKALGKKFYIKDENE